MKFMFMQKRTKNGLDGLLLPYTDLKDKKMAWMVFYFLTMTSCNNRNKVSKSRCSDSGCWLKIEVVWGIMPCQLQKKKTRLTINQIVFISRAKFSYFIIFSASVVGRL